MRFTISYRQYFNTSWTFNNKVHGNFNWIFDTDKKLFKKIYLQKQLQIFLC